MLALCVLEIWAALDPGFQFNAGHLVTHSAEAVETIVCKTRSLRDGKVALFRVDNPIESGGFKSAEAPITSLITLG